MSKARKMYIDVDGVLVVWDQTHNCTELARGFGRLMRFCKLHAIQPCWLTAWSKKPHHLEALGRLLWPDACPTMAVPQLVEYADGLKAAAIDYDSDFVWIEDGLGPDNAEILRQHGALDRFFWSDGVDPDCLLKFMAFTREKMNLPVIKDWGPAPDSLFAQPRHPSTDPNWDGGTLPG